MAEYGEWIKKGATLTDATTKAEYGVDREFIVKGIKTGIIEYREGAMWGNPCLRILRSQLEKYITDELGGNYLLEVKSQAELRSIKKEISRLKKELSTLQYRKRILEESL